MSPVNVLAAALCFLLAGAGCRSAGPVIDAADSTVPAIAGMFTGTLPCADCSGIRTDVTLFNSVRLDFTVTGTDGASAAALVEGFKKR